METYEYAGKVIYKIPEIDSFSCRGCVFDGDWVDRYCGPCTGGTVYVFGSDSPKKHSHYFKDVSDLDEIDVYQVLYLFEVTDPCVQHAVKKLLCAGQRGSKDKNKDIQEAIDTLNRYKEINDAS